MSSFVDFAPERTDTLTENVRRAAQLTHALRQLQIELGEDVAVVGEGSDARLSGELARAAGAASVAEFDAGTLGAAEAKSADALIFASDSGEILSAALRLVRNLGRVLLLGDVGPIDFDVYPDIHKRSIRLIGATPSQPSQTTIDFVKHLAASGRLHIDT